MHLLVKILTVSFAAILSACISTPQTRILKNSPPEDIARQGILSDTPFFPQRAYQCGPAALATMLGSRGVNVQPDSLTDRVFIPQRRGSLQIEMVATARSYGMLSYKLPPDISAILKEIDAGNPVLVLQELSLLLWPQWHYAVVIGYDLNTSKLILRSGTQSRLETSFSTFERSWKKADYWAYVFMSPGEIPATAEAHNFIKASQDLYQSGHPKKALTALRAGHKEWPNESIVLMALGNAEFTQGHHEKARMAFVREIEHHPLNSAAWNNLAYTLTATHCRTQAIRAIECALLIQPDDENLRHSAEEIRQISTGSQELCRVPACPY